jgi:hypothetical protein
MDDHRFEFERTQDNARQRYKVNDVFVRNLQHPSPRGAAYPAEMRRTGLMVAGLAAGVIALIALLSNVL